MRIIGTQGTLGLSRSGKYPGKFKPVKKLHQTSLIPHPSISQTFDEMLV